MPKAKGAITRRERNCPFLNEQDIVKAIAHKNVTKKYSFRKNKKSKEKVVKKQSDAILTVGTYEIYSCPVDTVNCNRGLNHLIGLINWTLDTKTPLVDGGLLNYTNWFYECYKVVVNEQRAIEREEIKKQDRKKPKKQANRPAPKLGGKKRRV